MRIYLDACCLHRPFDDHSQERVRDEAVGRVFQLCKMGEHEWVTSEAIDEEVARNPNEAGRNAVQRLLAAATHRALVTDGMAARATEFASAGLAGFDAIHLAVAEAAGCAILLTTDDGFERAAARLGFGLRTRVVNPVKWIAEVSKP